MSNNNKSPEMNSFLNSIFPYKRDGKQCSWCGCLKVKPENFKDDISRKEFTISFMCQKCQNDTFVNDQDDAYDPNNDEWLMDDN